MGVCCNQNNCIRSYFFGDKYYRGNKIFKEIKIKLDIENEKLDINEKSALQNCIDLVKEIEKERKEIANKFETFLLNTGACVLTQPTMERGLITYVVFLLTQIIRCAEETNNKFTIDDFSLSNLILITKEPPFININQDTLNNLKNKYSFDFNRINNLIKGRDSIIEFLSTIPKSKEIFKNQISLITQLANEKITNLFIFNKVQSLLDSLKFLFNFIAEIANGILDTQSQLTNPKKYKLFFNIASEAAQRKIDDPKEIAFFYSEGENCGKIENWKENITYRSIEPKKY